MIHSTEGPTDLPGTPGEPAPQQEQLAVAHCPGEWPPGTRVEHTTAMPESGDQAWQAFQAERAERIVILGRIGAHLEAEPTPRAVRAAGRRWAQFITTLADQIATKYESREAK